MKIKEVFPLIPGLFQNIETPIWSERYESMDMDLEFLTKYGEREVSPLVEYFIKDGELIEDAQSNIINMVYRKHIEGWTRKYEVLDVEYEALNTYGMTESENAKRDSTSEDTRSDSRDTTSNRTQLNEISKLRTVDLTNTNIKTGTDTTASEADISNSESVLGNKSSNQSNDSEDTLSFVDRMDTETRNLDRSSTSSQDTTDSTSTTLSFVDRDNVQTRDLTTTDNGSTTEDSTVEEQANVSTDESAYTYGYNTTNVDGVPTSRVENQEEQGKTTTTDSTTTQTNSSTDSGTITDSKTGSEKTQNSGTLKVSGTADETDTGTVNNAKTGSEKNTTVGTSTNSEELSNEITGSITEDGQQTTTYNTTDTSTNIGTESNVDTIDNKEDMSNGETYQGTTNSLGSQEDERTLTREGNNGSKTSPSLLREHIDFWKWNFLDDVYEDVAEMISLSVYR